MTIGKICQREVDLADGDEPIVEAAKRMSQKMVGTLVVLDEKRQPIGIVTDRDVAMRVVAEGRSLDTTVVREVMSAHPRTISVAAPVETALATMRQLGVRRLPVVQADGTLAGIVSLDDVISLLIEELRSIHGVLQKAAPSGTLV